MNGTHGRKRQPTRNAHSVLLNDQENNVLFELLGKKCNTLATGVAQIFLANGQNGAWNKFCTGVCCFVKDNMKRSYFIRVFSLKKKSLQWEQEMYNEFKYAAPRPYFLTFETNECRAALNFANESEAEKFRKSIDEKIRAKGDRSRVSSQQQIGSGGSVRNQPPPVPSHHKSSPGVIHHPPTNLTVHDAKSIPNHQAPAKKDKKGNKKKQKKTKLTKADISTPSGFTHIQHVGWDPNKGFDMNKLLPHHKKVFESVGISEQDMEDEDTAAFIYDFIDKYEKEKDHKEPSSGRSRGHAQNAPPAPPPAPPVRRNHEPPAPPNRRFPPAPPRVLPPPPPSSGIPPPPGIPQPPPPPPVGIPPPPPPAHNKRPQQQQAQQPSGGGGDGRGDLLAQIRNNNVALKKPGDRPVSTASSGDGDGRGDLLAQIRGSGAKVLKPVVERKDEVSGSAPVDSSLANALKSALNNRAKTIHSDSEDSDGDSYDDDEWDD